MSAIDGGAFAVDVGKLALGVPPGMVRLTPSRGVAVTLILMAEPNRTLGVGGFAASARTGRRPAKWYQDIPDDAISLDCLLDLDAIVATSKIETRLKWLHDMGVPGAGHAEPPSIRLAGDVWDNDKTITWVLSEQGIVLGTRLWTPLGDLRQQRLTITLERFTDAGDIEPIRITSTRTARGTRRRRTISTRSGDTLRAVALRELGSASRWTDLRTWNKKTLRKIDPDARLRTGTHLAIR